MREKLTGKLTKFLKVKKLEKGEGGITKENEKVYSKQKKRWGEKSRTSGNSTS